MAGKAPESGPEIPARKDVAADHGKGAFSFFEPKDFTTAGRLSAEQAQANTAKEMQKFPSADELMKIFSFGKKDTKPATVEPQHHKPGENKPENGVPERHKPEQHKPEQHKPEHHKPEHHGGHHHYKPHHHGHHHHKPGHHIPDDRTPEHRPGGQHPQRHPEHRPGRRPGVGPERPPESGPEQRPERPHLNSDHTRNIGDWNKFYRSQTRSNNCLPTAMSMMYADFVKHSPASDAELRHFEQVTHVGASGGYTGSARDIARQAESQIKGLHTAVVEGVDKRTLGAELDKHLKEGHTAIVGIKSPYSSGNHYIYVAGIDSHGKYIIGDSGRHGGGKLGKTIDREDLLNRMMQRGGGPRMVAGWTDESAPQTKRTGDEPGRREVPKTVETTKPKDVTDPKEVTTGSSERRQIKLKDAIVDVPKDLDPSKPIHFMTYFNGHRSGFEDGYKDAKLQEAMKNAPPNTVLISARWQDREHSSDSSMSQFQHNGGLNGILQEAFKGVPELQRNALRADDKIGVAGFSAGYNPVRTVLQDKNLASHVDNIVMLDSPSSAVRQYVYDNLAAFANGSKHLSMVGGDWRGSEYKDFEQTLKQKLHGADARGIRFTYTHTPHGEIPAKYFRGAAF